MKAWLGIGLCGVFVVAAVLTMALLRQEKPQAPASVAQEEQRLYQWRCTIKDRITVELNGSMAVTLEPGGEARCIFMRLDAHGEPL